MEREIVRVHGVTKRGPSEQVNDKQIILQAWQLCTDNAVPDAIGRLVCRTTRV